MVHHRAAVYFISYWGEPRNSRDLDLMLLTGFGGEQLYIDAILHDLEPRIENTRQFDCDKNVRVLKTRLWHVFLTISSGLTRAEKFTAHYTRTRAEYSRML